MALTIQLVIGTPCGGGNHFTVTATTTPALPSTPVVMTTSRPEILATPSVEDRETFMRVLTWLYVNQLPGRTPAQLKTAIEAKTLNLDVS